MPVEVRKRPRYPVEEEAHVDKVAKVAAVVALVEVRKPVENA
jgi:hypothetical protein